MAAAIENFRNARLAADTGLDGTSGEAATLKVAEDGLGGVRRVDLVVGGLVSLDERREYFEPVSVIFAMSLPNMLLRSRGGSKQWKIIVQAPFAAAPYFNQHQYAIHRKMVLTSMVFFCIHIVG
jgi:hypothetical protein